MPKVSSFGSLPRTLSDPSMRKKSMEGDRGLPVQPFTSQINKAESIASTAVRTADKINVSSTCCFWCLVDVKSHNGRSQRTVTAYPVTCLTRSISWQLSCTSAILTMH